MTKQGEASVGTRRPAEEAGGEDPAALGRRLRRAREQYGLGLRELARQVEVSPSALSQIETGKTRPSVRTLYALTTELGLSMDELFAGEARRPAAAPVVQPLTTRRSIELGAGVAWERLTAGEDPEVDFVEGHYAPGSSSGDGDGMTRHRGREYGVVTSGRLQLTVGAETHELGPGDSCCFDSRQPHRLRNPGPEPARAFWFVLARRD